MASSFGKKHLFGTSLAIMALTISLQAFARESEEDDHAWIRAGAKF